MSIREGKELLELKGKVSTRTNVYKTGREQIQAGCEMKVACSKNTKGLEKLLGEE